MNETIRIVCISDTHANTDHEEFPDIPNGDILIHAGDFTLYGKTIEHVAKFNDWLGTLPHEHKIVISGNHERMFDANLPYITFEEAEKMRKSLTNCIYLENSSVTIKGMDI